MRGIAERGILDRRAPWAGPALKSRSPKARDTASATGSLAMVPRPWARARLVFEHAGGPTPHEMLTRETRGIGEYGCREQVDCGTLMGSTLVLRPVALQVYNVGTILVLRWYCAGAALALCQHCTGVVLVLYWSALRLYWCNVTVRQ